jgi:hypothetical protein
MSGAPDWVITCDEERFPTVEAFESGTLDPEALDHHSHVFIAWKLLEENSLARATTKFLSALKRLTVALGIESKYHETISCFYMTLIAERRIGQAGQTWADFVSSNPDLLGPSVDLLARYYTRERLWSDLARRQFLLPDKTCQAVNDKGI